ncbi:MAG: glycosyltransferase family 2 protein, partial [Gammaproteobacteria bacterium]
ALVLRALAAQSRTDFEAVIADDGSTAETATLIGALRPNLPYALQHIWQEDRGFRAAMARNRAIAVARGDYLIFLDGDCIPQCDFVARHAHLAEPGYFVAGNRILLSERFTSEVVQRQLQLWSWRSPRWLASYLRGDINRLLPLLRLPDNTLRKRHNQQWQGAKTSNLAMWRRDVLGINGFDESFQGWGHEDAELVVRLLRSGVQRKDGRCSVPVLHLWHTEQDRSFESANRHRLEQCLESEVTAAQRGIDQYLQ